MEGLVLNNVTSSPGLSLTLKVLNMLPHGAAFHAYTSYCSDVVRRFSAYTRNLISPTTTHEWLSQNTLVFWFPLPLLNSHYFKSELMSQTLKENELI